MSVAQGGSCVWASTGSGASAIASTCSSQAQASTVEIHRRCLLPMGVLYFTLSPCGCPLLDGGIVTYVPGGMQCEGRRGHFAVR